MIVHRVLALVGDLSRVVVVKQVLLLYSNIMSLNGKVVKGVLLDITGVLIESGAAIAGSVEAVNKLEQAGK